MIRRPHHARLAALALLLALAANTTYDSTHDSRIERIEQARLRYLPAAVVPVLGIRG